MRGRSTHVPRPGEAAAAPAPPAAAALVLTAPDRLLSTRQVLARVNMGQTTLYRRLAAGAFPKPVRHGEANFWRESAILNWMANLPEVDHSRTGPRVDRPGGRSSGAPRS